MSDCEKCGKDLDEHPMIDVSNVKVLQMCDRHPKWQRVEPGHVIPAGQPYRIEYGDASRIGCGQIGGEFVSDAPREVDEPGQYPHGNEAVWFVDSSWRPPLVLPTEPTWGIAVHTSGEQAVAQWSMVDVGTHLNAHGRHLWHREHIADFIPLTEEQVQRIEAAR